MIINIRTTNSAFDDCEMGINGETARILRDLANAIERGEQPLFLYDINGNKTGTVRGYRNVLDTSSSAGWARVQRDRRTIAHESAGAA